MNPRRIAVALLAGLLLTGCTDDPPPDPDAAPTPTASSRPTPTETAEPTAASESAVDFARRWVDTLNVMRSSGDDGEYRSVSSSCRACMGFADTFDQIYQAGGAIQGGAWHVRGAEDLGATGGERTVLLRLKTDPTRYTESANGEVQRLPGGRPTIRLVMSQASGEWSVLDLYEESV